MTLTCPRDHSVLDLFVTQRAYGDLDTALAAHTLVLTRLQCDVRLGGTTESTGQPHPCQGFLQLATPLSVEGGGGERFQRRRLFDTSSIAQANGKVAAASLSFYQLFTVEQVAKLLDK